VKIDFGKLLALLPAMVAAYQSVYDTWTKAHPDEFATWMLAHPSGTRDQYEDERFNTFNAMLVAESVAVQSTSAVWLAEHGYELVAGKWVKKIG
jgi:hypothetical protein